VTAAEIEHASAAEVGGDVTVEELGEPIVVLGGRVRIGGGVPGFEVVNVSRVSRSRWVRGAKMAA
jgi:hypothetical protein